MNKFILSAVFVALFPLAWSNSISIETHENFSTAERQFSVSFLKLLNEQQQKSKNGGNLIFSPYSIHRVLFLASLGANGKTKDRLESVLNLQDYGYSKEMANLLYAANKFRYEQSSAFSSADKLFVDQGAKLLELIQQDFSDSIEMLDFQGDAEDARLRINSFVAQATRGHIKDLFSSETIDSDTSLVLANGAYFEGAWTKKFKEADILPKSFYGSKIAKVRMMTQTGIFKFRNMKLYSFLELPYGDDKSNYSMLIFLPKDRSVNAFDNFIQNVLTENMVISAYNTASKKKIYVELPKMSFEGEYNLNEALETMGLADLFNEENIDLSGFGKLPKLRIKDVMHKAKVEVNAEGTTAAAATGISYETLLFEPPLYYDLFVCDHPFVFAIFDTDSKQILFTGVYRDPSQ